ncbi:sugar transporter (hexose transporter [Aspergillus udagawae]|uniref:Sugar transporter (hexose transporter) n=1 Tax=Aspergillus udagawae TaxID=91492 RepID=A0A8H3SDJ6_9EURO|nr:sugar transporter (hexose transporter [Aspergillus udagawae]
MIDDAGLLNGLQAVASWNEFFDHPQGTTLGLYAASLYLPSFLTAYLGDFLSQRFGRRYTLALGSFVVLAGGLINAFANSAGMWVAGRAIIGGGGGLAKVAAPALIQEIAHPRLRPMLASCYYPFFYFGSLLSALLCFAALYIPGDWSWRTPSIVQIVGPILVLLTLISCPESPRWLVSKNRIAEASSILSKYHANGILDDPLVQWELVEIGIVLEREGVGHHASYRDFFMTAGNRRRLVVLLSLCIGSNWVGNGIISYYLTPVLHSIGITSPVQIMLLTSGLAIWNLILSFGSALNVERFGRRPLFLVSIIGMLVSYCFIMAFSASFATTKNHAVSIAVVPSIFLYYGFYDIAWTPLPVPYTAEILPFGLRTKGLALFTSVGTMANSFNQFVNPIALQALTWKYYAVYIVILLFYLIFAYFMYPETKHHTIEEVSMMFDKRDAEMETLKKLAVRELQKRSSEAFEHSREEEASKLKGSCSHMENALSIRSGRDC